jgi:hypothetical protein
VNPIPPQPTIITNAPFCAGQTLVLSTTLTAFATYSWTGPNGFTSSNLINNIPNANSIHAGTYSLVVSVSGCPSPMATANIVITDPLGAQTLSAAQTLCTGSTPSALTGANPTGGTGVFVYQWESSLDDVNWTSMPGSTLQGFGPGALITTTYYRRIVSSGLCPASTSGSLMIRMEPLLGQNTISPAQTICAGDVSQTLLGSAPTGGNGLYIYQWESSADSLQWTVLAGATSATFQPPVPLQTVWYRREVFSGCTDVSLPVRINIESPVTGNTIGNDQTLCESFRKIQH